VLVARAPVNTTSRLPDGIQHDNSRPPQPRRATGMPTKLLAAQQRVRLDGSLISTQSFSTPFNPGEIINGKYRVEELIGVGGVGFVVAATHLQLDDSVALKILKPEFASHPEAVQSFTIEARASFRIKSEHVARVYDVDILPSGVPFMVMELLRGQDLRRILKRHSYLSIDLAVDLALQTCEALATAHACQIVHRDVKPENLFVTQSGDAAHIKVLDFGISQALLTPGATPAMVAVGTPPYMAPEQIRGANDLDARADLWSLGCVLYELLTGMAPFARMSIMQACAAVLEEEPAPLRENRPDAPPELEEAVMRCLRKDPSKRFLNVAELAAALAPFGKRSLYCAERCQVLLSRDVRSSDPARRRAGPPPPPGAEVRRLRVPTGVPTGTLVPVTRIPTRIPTRVDVALASPRPHRRQTMNPLSTPVVFASRKPSLLGLASPTSAPVATREVPPSAITVEPAAIVEQLEDADVDFVPGLRPKRIRWLVLAASLSLAIGLAYLTVSELNRNDQPRASSVRQLRKRVSAAIEANAFVDSAGSNKPAVGASTSVAPTNP
jgi:serine/threonine protein kinase